MRWAPTLDRFWAQVDKRGDDECWPWLGTVNASGYGRGMKVDGARRQDAHRVSYLLLVGQIPAEMTVDHMCFNTLCVNPAHLRLLTPSENSSNQRSASATRCANGHEYTAENTYVRPRNGKAGRRDCRTCIRKRVAEYTERKRNGAAA